MSNKLLITMLFVLLAAAGAVQAGGDAERGKQLAVEVDCASCHGDDGKGDEDVPAIAGMDKEAHLAALKGYASGEREDESGMMAMYAEELSEEDMADLAAYYASLE